MSGAQVSSFPSQNILFEAASGQALQRGQANAQALGANEMEYMARAAQGILSASGGDEAKLAELYPAAVADLQRYGFARNAPAVSPGKATLERIAAMGTSSEKLGEQAAVGRSREGLRIPVPGATPNALMTPAPGATTPSVPISPYRAANLPQGVTPEEDQFVRTVWGEANGEPVAGQQAVAHVIRNRARGSGETSEQVIFKPHQFEPWNSKRRADLEALDPTSPDYQRILNTVVRPVMSGQAQDPTGGATHFLNSKLVTSRGDQIPGWASGNRTTIGNHDFYYAPYGRGGGAPTQQQPGAPGGTRTQVASVKPTQMEDGTTAPQQPQQQPPQQPPAQQQPGQQQTQQQPQQQQPAVAMPTPPTPLVGDTGLTAPQIREYNNRLDLARTPAQQAQVVAWKEQLIQHNGTVQRQYQNDVQQAQTRQDTLRHQADTLQIQRGHLTLAEDANTRANQKLADDAREKGETYVPGTGIEAVHENTLQKYAAKLAKGEQLTDTEQRLYDGAYYALQQSGGQTGVMTDPNNPGQQIPYQTTRRLAPSLPEPKGGALPAVISQPGAAKVDQPSADQGKVAGFADRIQMALPIITDTSPAAMSRWQQLLGQAPIYGNSLITEEFQQHMQAERNFINATLRRESGAEIKQTEFDNARKQYIPQPGDGPKVLEQKARNRETILNGMIREAGPAYKPPEPAKAPDSTSGGDRKPSRVIEYGPDGKRIKQ